MRKLSFLNLLVLLALIVSACGDEAEPTEV
jgi:hypothetical protein